MKKFIKRHPVFLCMRIIYDDIPSFVQMEQDHFQSTSVTFSIIKLTVFVCLRFFMTRKALAEYLQVSLILVVN